MRDFIKKVIDDKIKNLHPDLENLIIEEVLSLGLNREYKIKYFIRKRLELPKVGSDKKIYWEKRGWSEEDIEKKRNIKKMPSSPMKVTNWLNKINEKTGQLYTIEEAEYKVRSFRKLNKEYWLEKGYSEEESTNKVKEYQKENSNKFVKKILENPDKYKDRTITQVEYWVKNGFSKEDSIKKIKANQDKSSIEFFIKKYGEEEGTIRYMDRLKQLSYTSSKKYYTDKYGSDKGNSIYTEIIKRRTIGFNRSSKEAFRFLLPIYKFLRKCDIDKKEIYWGVGSSSEWFINSNNCLFFYDFTIPSLKIVIEFHGIAFHPKENEYNWVSIYGETYEYKYNIDKLKKEIAEKNGFQYFHIYSDEDINAKQIEIIEYIKKIISI
jgi:hypothetical protein